ncbi:PqqD family protein [Melioribacter sp. OK-6-Me]|uniref:PqqD family protein n=1 Tax=unclassified Melioribacter TaxID=2627329 RepID=UPI003EDAFBD0
MNFFGRQKIDKNYLDLIPVRKVEYEKDGNLVTLLIPKFTSNFATKFIMPRLKSKYIRLRLDELGSASWLEIDDNSKVAEICNRLRNKFGNKIEPVEERLTRFLTRLYVEKIISFKEIEGEKI